MNVIHVTQSSVIQKRKQTNKHEQEETRCKTTISITFYTQIGLKKRKKRKQVSKQARKQASKQERKKERKGKGRPGRVASSAVFTPDV